jgi:dipeptidyl aminopeptidase/acylaminoacyl peptidase
MALVQRAIGVVVCAHTLVAPLTIDETLAFGNVYSTVAVSPGGRTVLYTRCVVAACDLWRVAVDGGRAVNLTAGHGSNFAPVWAPAGARFAFLSDRDSTTKLYVEDTSGAVTAIGPARPADAPVWVDSLTVAYLAPDVDAQGTTSLPADPLLTASPIPGTTARIYRSPANLSAAEHARYDTVRQAQGAASVMASLAASLVVANVATGARTDMGRVHLIPTFFRKPFAEVSPDGGALALTETTGERSLQWYFDVTVIPLHPPSRRQVLGPGVPMLHGGDLSWSPDGRSIVWTATGPRGQRGDVYVADAAARVVRRLTTAPIHPYFDPYLIERVDDIPVWLDAHTVIVAAGPPGRSDGGPNQLWAFDIQAGTARRLVMFRQATVISVLREATSARAVRSPAGILVSLRTADGDHAYAWVNVRTGAVTTLSHGPYTVRAPLGSSELATADRLFDVRESAGVPPDLWVQPLDGGAARRISHVNPALDSLALGDSRRITYAGPDGRALHGAVLLPPSWRAGHPVPFLVVTYPGTPTLSMVDLALHSFGLGEDNASPTMQLFATRGYGVLFADAPTRMGTGMRDLARTVMPGVDAIIRMGYADSTRIGTFGHSYGGYDVYALIAQTRRFRAAVASAGLADWVAGYLGMDDDGRSQGIAQAEDRWPGPGGTLWTNRQGYIDNSPLFFFDRVTTPVLIVHGTRDHDENARHAFVALRRLGKDAELVLYGGEGHVSTDWSAANQRDVLQRMIDWFDHYLCPDRVSPVSCAR